MRKTLALFSLLILFLLATVASYASSFNQSYVRLDTLNSSSPLSGTICSDPSSAGAGTESKIAITFPSDFTINTTASNWTTSVTNLPAGATAWPSIGATATSISSKTVTFASGDLTASTLYCFNFSGSSSTTGNAGSDKTGTLTSKNNSDITIDSTTYALAIVSNSNINITASVDPQVSDLPITIESTTAGTTFPENSTINYKITYGNNATTSIPLTIQAQWTQGTISGNPSPSVDILDYVVGSATNAYGSTPAVINTVNRTITWTISSIPASTTGQTVTFSLKTNNSYTGTSSVSFSVLARATSGSTTTPDVSVNQNYLFSGTTTTNLGGPGDGRSDGKSSGSTPSTQQPALPIFNSIEIYSISKSYAKIFVTTNKSTTLTIQYGKSLKSLSQNVKTALPATESITTLPDLEPNTDYYFKITAKDTSGNIVTSDIFTFKTASESITPTIDLQSFIVTSNNNILLNPQGQLATGQTTPKYIIVIPYSTVFEFHFTLNKQTQIKNIQAIVKNKNVLGASTFGQPEANSNLVDLVETRPGVYAGRLLSPGNPGNYELYVKVIDYSGNITIQKIVDIRVVNKFKILEKGLKNPIENARVLIYLYNPTTKVYEVISPQILPINNPSYSNPEGLVNVVLPMGKYKAEILAIGYNDNTVEFELNPEYGEYPTIYLEKQQFNISNFIKYYWTAFTDNINESQIYIKQRADSNRLFDLITMGSLFIFIIISVLSISARTHIGVFYLPYFLIFKLKILFKKNTGRIIFGKVMENEAKIPISRAVVNLITADGTKILATLKTNKLGEFYYNNPQGQDFKIKIEKQGFETLPVYDFKNSEVKEIPIVFKLKTKEIIKRSLLKIIFIYAEDFLGMAMESIILFLLLTQIYFIYTFGFLRVAPFLTLTILNLVLIFTYLYKPKGLEK